jgi:hypothetical protein
MMNDLKQAAGRPWQRAATHIVPVVYLMLACGEASSPSPQTAESAQHVQQAADDSATDPEQESTGEGSATAAEQEGTDGAALIECDVPADSGEAVACHAGRELARCTSPNGSAICITEENGRCDGTDANFECESICEPNEYALSCGSVGGLAPGGAQLPAEACRSVFPTPGGVVFYCCPCPS